MFRFREFAMIFQFCCPNGHLLQGDDTQAGATIACPVCAMQFIIPSPTPQAPATPPSAPAAPPPPPGMPQEFFGGQNAPASDNPLDFRGNAGNFVVGTGHFGDTRRVAPKTASTVSWLHIPCPSGHIMEITRDYLGEEVVCPQCGRDFILRYEKTLEYQKEKDQRDTIAAAKYAKIWLQVANALAVGVVGLVIFLIFVAS